MSNQTLDTGPVPEVFFDQALGDLQVRGWEEPRLSIQAEPETLQLEQQDDVIHLSCQGDCDLRLPVGATLRIGVVNGDLSLKLLEDQLFIGEVRGDLFLRNIAAAQIQTVHGDLAVKNASDDLNIDLVHGDADIRQVAGQCVVNEVLGNLDLASVDGDIQVGVRGNARLRLDRLSGSEYKIQAGGDIYCYLPDDADAQISLTSEGERIKVRLPQGSKTFPQAQYKLTLGEGAASLTLIASGAVYLFIEKSGWSETEPAHSFPGAMPGNYGEQIAQQIEAQMQAQMAEITRRLNEQMEHLTDRLGKIGLTTEESERIVEQARRASEREASRAQEKLRRAQEKLERKLEAQRRRAEQHAQMADRRSRRHTWSFEWPAPATPPASSKDASTEEERLMILRMLEQKKITLEQADQLLSALEGDE